MSHYHSFEKAKVYSTIYTLEPTDEIIVKQQEDGMLGYASVGQFATTGSNIFEGGQIIDGNLTIVGDIYANTFNVTTYSVSHFSASTNFGLDEGDTHTFTGSVYITGSLNVIGGINGVINATNGVVSSSAQITSFGFVSGSYETTGRSIVSSSAQITSFGFVSGSYETTGRSIVSGSISYNSLTDIPQNIASGSYETTGRSIISSSAQITAFGFISSSTTIDTGSFAITGSNLFRGDQTITGSLFISGTTELGGNIVPKTAKGATLGTLELPFRDIYLQSASINIASDIPGGRNATISNADGNVSIAAAGFQLKSGSFVSFEVSEDARVKIKVPIIPAGDIGAFSIIGNASGTYQPITSAGGMVHITGNDGQVNRLNMDAFGSGSTTSFNGIIARAARGTAANPTQTKSGDVTLRLTGTGWRGDTGFGGTTIVGGTTTAIEFIALEDQMNNARGSAQQFYNAPIGNNNRVLSAQIDTTGLFVSGAFTSSLSQGYIWVGDSNNRTKLFSTSSFAITGSNTFSGSQGISGSLYVSESIYVTDEFYVNGNKLFNYGQFSDTTTQSGSANTAYSMKLNTTDISHNISVVSGSRITVQNTGIYNLQFSAQLDNTSNTNEVVDIWVAITGSNVANSNTQVAINKAQAGNSGKLVAAWNYLLPMSASNYVELKWSSNGGGIILHSSGSASNPTRPAIPSAIATITQIA
jgi:hypothetical protein